MTCKLNWKSTLVLVFAVLFLITACGGQQAKPETGQAEQEQEQPLALKYRNVVVSDFTTTQQIQNDYPDAVNQCQANLVWALENKKLFESVVRNKSGLKYPAGCLLVQASVPDMRIVHGAARFWGGAFAGSSYMNVDLKLIDAATQKVVREKQISSANNAWAAAWVGGSTDQSLPSDMGKILAEYIGSIIPN